MRKVTMVVELEVEVTDDSIDLDDLCLDVDMNLIDVITVQGDAFPSERVTVGHVTGYGTKQVIVHE